MCLAVCLDVVTAIDMEVVVVRQSCHAVPGEW